jgi:16S rRNA (guanine(966)-N(2))-methyltransferase RsmD
MRKRKRKENKKNTKPEIRITTGVAKNKKLKAPEIEGFRAVQEIAKSSVFSILGEKVIGAVCLDLFSGSGNMGLEALSRGAEWCDFVDSDYISAQVIRENIEDCGFSEKAEVEKREAAKYVVNAPRTYDIIFSDPFYEDTSQKYLISNLEHILNENGVVIFFHGENLDLENLTEETNLKIVDERKFGKSFFTILTVK